MRSMSLTDDSQGAPIPSEHIRSLSVDAPEVDVTPRPIRLRNRAHAHLWEHRARRSGSSPSRSPARRGLVMARAATKGGLGKRKRATEGTQGRFFDYLFA